MKKFTVGVFTSRSSAESAILSLVKDLGIPNGDISYVYRDTQSTEVHSVTADEETALDGAVTGAVTGGTIGAIAGLATVAGLIPVIGPIFAAGPLLVGLGLGAGAVATTAAAAVTGAAAGGLIGALASIGVPDARAREYEERITAGDTLVTVQSDNSVEVADILENHGGSIIESYEATS